MKPMANHYHDLVNVYANSSSEELRIIILKYSEAFTRDNNMGLAKQASIPNGLHDSNNRLQFF